MKNVAPFNGLSPAELERLAKIAEEAAEVIQAIGKILCHGYESRHPDGGPTNRRLLETELGDLRSVTSMAIAADDLSQEFINIAEMEKDVSVKKYLHHQ